MTNCIVSTIPTYVKSVSEQDYQRSVRLWQTLAANGLRNGARSLLLEMADWISKKPSAVRDVFFQAAQNSSLEDVVKQTMEKLVLELKFREELDQSRIRELYLAEIFENIEEVAIPVGAINEDTAHENHVDLLYVAAIAKYLKAKQIFEFGTYMGRTTRQLASLGEDVHVTTLNLPPDKDTVSGHLLQFFFKNSPVKNRINQIFCDSREFDPTPYRQSMDLIFIDADHSYEGVKCDTEKAFEMLAPGGTVIWHDYAPKSPGVVQYMREFTQEKPVFRVHKTCLTVYRDGIDAMTFQPHPAPWCLREKSMARAA